MQSSLGYHLGMGPCVALFRMTMGQVANFLHVYDILSRRTKVNEKFVFCAFAIFYLFISFMRELGDIWGTLFGLMLIIACVVNFDEGRSHRKPSEVHWGRLKHHPHAIIVEVGAVVDEH